MKNSIATYRKKFLSENAALMAFQMAQLYFIQAGFLTTSSVNLENKRIVLTVHFELPNFPTLPIGFKYSIREIMSYYYFSEVENKPSYVRTMDLYFKY